MRNGIDYILDNIDKDVFPEPHLSSRERYLINREFATDDQFMRKQRRKEEERKKHRVERLRKEYLKYVDR